MSIMQQCKIKNGDCDYTVLFILINLPACNIIPPSSPNTTHVPSNFIKLYACSPQF